jgi:hypothetical protein
MPQHYSDPAREQDPHALPDVETWQSRVWRIECECGDYEVPETDDTDPSCPSCGRTSEPGRPVTLERTPRMGWFYWFCFPGCLPDDEPVGPFETEEDALADARGGLEE